MVMMSFVVVLLVLGLISSVSAIKATIGSSQMTIKADMGDQIERSVLVKNDNEYPVDIEIFVSGDLAEHTILMDDKFSLPPEGTRKARFIIDVQKPGTTETKINVQFIPQNDEDGKNGAGLSSTVTIIAEKNGWFDFRDDEEGDESDDNGDESEASDITGAVIVENSGDNSKITFALWGTLFTFILFVVVMALYSVSNKKVKTKSKKNVLGR